MSQIPNNTNELAALELALANVTATALTNADSFIRQVTEAKQDDLNPYNLNEKYAANLSTFQNIEATARKTIQRTKAS